MGDIDPSLGISVDFDSQGFRDAIHFAMEMGAAPDPTLRPTFIFKSTVQSYRKNGVPVPDPRLDRDGKPLDPDIEAVETSGNRVQVDCAIEIIRADADELPVGNFRPTKAVVTLLDEEYAQVKGCREMVYDGDRYLFGYELEALGLFDVGTFTLIFYCLDDS
jgi:hypothetical protein